MGYTSITKYTDSQMVWFD